MSSMKNFFGIPSAPGSAAPSTRAGSSSLADVDSALWVDKYKPTTTHQMCYPVMANKLKAWLENFYLAQENSAGADPKRQRGVLLSGPPGVGKTTTVHVVSKDMGLTIVEYNASDFRSRKSLRERVSDCTTNRGFQIDAKGYGRMLLLMDEVDGCDIGGVGEIIEMLKTTQVPIICTCNDRWHPKLRSLVNHVEDLRFSRPPCNLVANFLCDRVLAREGVTLSKPLLQDIIKQSGSDIRNMLNNLQVWTLHHKSLEQSQLAAYALQSTKNGDAGIFETAEYFLLQGTSRGERHTIDELTSVYYNSDLVDMFVQENYLHYNPAATSASGADEGGTTNSSTIPPYYQRHATTWMEAVQQASDAISRSDAASKIMYVEQNWSVSRAHMLLSSVLPCAYTRGKYESFLTGQQVFFDRQRPVKFPTWLGHNSTLGKNKRLLRCLTMQATHPGHGVSGNSEDVLLDYIPFGLEPKLTRPLVHQEKERGIEDVIATMGQYHLMRDDWDYVVNAATFRKATAGSASPLSPRPGVYQGSTASLPSPGMKSCASAIPAAVKSAFTRAVNKKFGAQSYVKAALKRVGDSGAALSAAEQDNEEDSDGERKPGHEVVKEKDIPGLVVKKPPPGGRGKKAPSGAAKTAPAKPRAKRKAAPAAPKGGARAGKRRRSDSESISVSSCSDSE